VTLAHLDCPEDRLLCFPLPAGARKHHRPDARHRAALVLRMPFQELLDQCRGLVVATETEQSVRGVERQKGRILFERSAIEDLERVLVLRAAHVDDTEAVTR